MKQSPDTHGQHEAIKLPEQLTPQQVLTPEAAQQEDTKKETELSEPSSLESVREELAQFGSPEEFKKNWEARVTQWETECAEFIRTISSFSLLKDEIRARSRLVNNQPAIYSTHERLDILLEKFEKLHGVTDNDPSWADITDIRRIIDLETILFNEIEPRLDAVERQLTSQETFHGAITGIREAIRTQHNIGSREALTETATTLLKNTPEQSAMAAEILKDQFLTVSALKQIEQAIQKELSHTEQHFTQEMQPIRNRIKADPDHQKKFDRLQELYRLRDRAPQNKQAAYTQEITAAFADHDTLIKLKKEEYLTKRPIVREKNTVDEWIQSLQGEYSKEPSWTNFALEQFTLGMALQDRADARYLFGSALATQIQGDAERYQKEFANEIKTFQWTDERKTKARELMRGIWPAINVYVPRKESGEIGLDSRASLLLLDLAGLRPKSNDRAKERNRTCDPGEKYPGTITINSGNTEGIESPIADRAKDDLLGHKTVPYQRIPRELRRLVIDHHGEASAKEFSASRYLYNSLNSLGFFDTPEFAQLAKLENISKQGIEKMLTFVDQEDNKTNQFWREQPPGWWASHAPDTMLTLAKNAFPYRILRYFETHNLDDVSEPLTDKDIKMFHLTKAQEKMRALVGHAQQLWKTLTQNGESTRYQKKNNEVIVHRHLRLKSPTYGEVILATNGFPGSIDGVRGTAGKHAVYAIYEPARGAFFLSTTGQTLPEDFLATGERKRESMWVRGGKDEPIPSVTELLTALGVREGSLSQIQKKTLDLFTKTRRYFSPKEVLGVNLQRLHSNDWISALAEKIKDVHDTGTGAGEFSQATLDKELREATHVQSVEQFYQEKAQQILEKALQEPPLKKSRKKTPLPVKHATLNPTEKPEVPAETVQMNEAQEQIAHIEQQITEIFYNDLRKNPEYTDYSNALLQEIATIEAGKYLKTKLGT